MRADRREEDKPRCPRTSNELQLVQLRQRVLIGDAPPAEVRAVVIQGALAVNLVESIEDTLRPFALQPGHQSNYAIAVSGKAIGQDLAVLREQQVVGPVVLYRATGQKAHVGEPGRAAERRRPHVG